jgi:hypothetical protein
LLFTAFQAIHPPPEEDGDLCAGIVKNVKPVIHGVKNRSCPLGSDNVIMNTDSGSVRLELLQPDD